MNLSPRLQVLAPGQIIDQLLEERKQRRPRYSLRALARDLGVSHSFLSQIRRGHYRPSSRACITLSRAVGSETLWGKLLHDAATDALDRNAKLQRKTKETFSNAEAAELDPRTRWYDFALLDLTGLRDFDPSTAWCANRLGIGEAEVEEALGRLHEAGLIRRRGNSWAKAKKLLVIPTPSRSSEELRQYHQSVIGRALVELNRTDDRAFSARDITGALIPMNPDRLPEARKRIARFRRELIRLLSQGNCTELYALNVQLFPLKGQKR